MMHLFFEPRSVAVIGASTNPKKDGNIILQNILDSDFAGEIYPINPGAAEVLGRKAYPSLLEVPGPVDLAVIIIPARSCVEAMEDCARKSVKAVIIEATGFAEVGEAGKHLQDQIVDLAKTHGIRVMGPNCTGIVSRNITTTFFPIKNVPKGDVVLIGQSGLLAAGMASDIVVNRSLNVNKICSIGNACDVNENDLLQYFGDDPHTAVISLYLEGIADGRTFVPTARRVAAKKPVILLMGGRSEAGAKAAMSHTGSIASNAKIMEAAIRQTGCIRADEFSELKDFARVLATQPIPSDNRVAIVTAAGSVGVVVSDLCAAHGLRTPPLNPDTVEALREVFPPNMSPSNPVDLWYSIEKVGMVKTVETTLARSLQDPGIDAAILILAGFTYTLPLIDQKTVQRITKASGKPVIVCMIVGYDEYKTRILRELGRDVPVFTSLLSGVKALSKLCEYGIRRKQLSSEKE